MRADAQRNYERLLQEARQAFMTHGTDVALEDIARHAGVGIGTLYRHFPDRYSLMNAVFEQEVEALTARARELLAMDDSAQALSLWLRTVGVHSTAYRGLAEAITKAPDARMPACKTLLRTAGGSLLWRAQQTGSVRGDVEIADLLKMTYAVVQTAERNIDDRGLFDRLMSLMVDGMRVRSDEDGSPEGFQESMADEVARTTGRTLGAAPAAGGGAGPAASRTNVSVRGDA